MNPKVKERREIEEIRIGEERNADNWCKWQAGKNSFSRHIRESW